MLAPCVLKVRSGYRNAPKSHTESKTVTPRHTRPITGHGPSEANATPQPPESMRTPAIPQADRLHGRAAGQHRPAPNEPSATLRQNFQAKNPL